MESEIQQLREEVKKLSEQNTRLLNLLTDGNDNGYFTYYHPKKMINCIVDGKPYTFDDVRVLFEMCNGQVSVMIIHNIQQVGNRFVEVLDKRHRGFCIGYRRVFHTNEIIEMHVGEIQHLFQQNSIKSKMIPFLSIVVREFLLRCDVRLIN